MNNEIGILRPMLESNRVKVRTEGNIISNHITEIFYLTSELNSLRGNGSHAFWLHIDSDKLAIIEDNLQSLVDAIQDEIDHPQ